MQQDKERKIFSDNLNYYMNKFGKSQADIVSDLGVNKSTISTWCKGVKMPRMGTIQILADYFGIKKSDLVEEKDDFDKDLDLSDIPGLRAFHEKNTRCLVPLPAGHRHMLRKIFLSMLTFVPMWTQTLFLLQKVTV